MFRRYKAYIAPRARARIFDCQLSEEFARRFHYLIGGRLKRKVALIILPFFMLVRFVNLNCAIGAKFISVVSLITNF